MSLVAAGRQVPSALHQPQRSEAGGGGGIEFAITALHPSSTPAPHPVAADVGDRRLRTVLAPRTFPSGPDLWPVLQRPRCGHGYPFQRRHDPLFVLHLLGVSQSRNGLPGECFCEVVRALIATPVVHLSGIILLHLVPASMRFHLPKIVPTDALLQGPMNRAPHVGVTGT